MEIDKKIKLVYSFTRSAIAAVVFVAASAILAELYAPFKDFLKNNFYHHWVGKSVISLAILIFGAGLCYLIPHKPEIKRLAICFWVLSIAATLGTLAIFGFSIYEYVNH